MDINAVISQVVVICGLITGVAAVITIVCKAVITAKRPNEVQNERLDKIEERLNNHDELFMKDLKRFERIEEGNYITQKSILALLSHGIDGNEIDGLRKAKNELQEYLLSNQIR